MKRAGAVIVFLLAFAASAFAEKFLSVSDIHFDPFADPAIVTKLEAADVSQWDAIFASSSVTTFSTYDSDTNVPLLRSALAEMRKALPSPAFVMISGDFLAHGFDKSYPKYATDKSQSGYSAFVAKTIAYVASTFRKTFPGVRVYPTLGNNDSDCGDYAIAPNGPFLASFRDTWKEQVGSRSFDRRFPTAGYYTADVPRLHRVRIIALDTVLFSTSYENKCGTPSAAGDPDAGMRQLEWLNAELHAAAKHGKRVWLLFHIPPGMNVYNTVESTDTCPTPQTFWKDDYAQRYLRIVGEHRNTIIGSFAGHTHMDEFRLASGDFIHITPSVSPLFGNNPAFEIIDVDRNGTIADYTAWHLPAVTLPWAREYAFDEAYAKPKYDAATLTQLGAAIGGDATTRDLYFGYFSSGSTKSTAGALVKWQGYWCGLNAMTESAFTACYCAAKP